MKQTRLNLIVFFILLIFALFFRLYQLPDRLLFNWDQQRDAFVVYRLLTEAKLTLSPNLSIIFWLTIAFLIFLYSKSNQQFKSWFWAWLVTPLVFSIYSQRPSEYYFNFTLPIIILALAIFLAYQTPLGQNIGFDYLLTYFQVPYSADTKLPMIQIVNPAIPGSIHFGAFSLIFPSGFED